MRGAPQVGFSATMRKMSSRNSLLTHLLPAPVRCRESHFQYNLNPVRCQRTTVPGRTRTNAHFHPYQSRRNITQNNLSEIANRGCGCLRFKTVSCCRRARFSRSNSRRERRHRIARTGRSLSRQRMSQSRVETGNPKHAINLIDLTADHYFGERQLYRSCSRDMCNHASYFWLARSQIDSPVIHGYLL